MSKEHKDLRHWVYYIYGSAVISIYMGVDGVFRSLGLRLGLGGGGG